MPIDLNKMFKTMNTGDDDWIETMSARLGGVVMPIIDLENNNIIKPTYLSHHKFSLPSDIHYDEDTTYRTCIYYLKLIMKINPAMFEGELTCYKKGALKFDKEYETTIRVWGSEKFGKRIIFRVSLAGYKDAITEKIKTPSK